jgi:hypothetical protein
VSRAVQRARRLLKPASRFIDVKLSLICGDCCLLSLFLAKSDGLFSRLLACVSTVCTGLSGGRWLALC